MRVVLIVLLQRVQKWNVASFSLCMLWAMLWECPAQTKEVGIIHLLCQFIVFSWNNNVLIKIQHHWTTTHVVTCCRMKSDYCLWNAIMISIQINIIIFNATYIGRTLYMTVRYIYCVCIYLKSHSLQITLTLTLEANKYFSELPL